MSTFSRQLGETVGELRRAALDHFDYWVLCHGGTGRWATLDESETRVVPSGPDPTWAQDLLNELHSDLDELDRRFAGYSRLNHIELDLLQDRLCQPDLTSLGETWIATSAPQDAAVPTSIAEEINYVGSRWVYLRGHSDDSVAAPVWESATARAFNDRFILPFADVTARQVHCAVYLANAVRVFHNATVATQDDVLAIADATLTALRARKLDAEVIADRRRTGGDFLGWLGSVLPPKLKVVASAGSAALKAAADNIDPGEHRHPERYIHPVEWTPKITAAVLDQLDTLASDLREQDRELARAISADADDNFRTAEFQLPRDRPAPPSRIDKVLIEDIEFIYETGRRYFPAAAQVYRATVGKLDEAEIPSWFGSRLYPHARARYNIIRSSLRHGLGQSADDLQDAGNKLVRTCKEITNLDAESAAAIARVDQTPLALPRADHRSPTPSDLADRKDL